jgi:hypothetical protein
MMMESRPPRVRACPTSPSVAYTDTVQVVYVMSEIQRRVSLSSTVIFFSRTFNLLSMYCTLSFTYVKGEIFSSMLKTRENREMV